MDPEIEKLIVLNLKYVNRERTLNLYVFADFSVKALFQISRSIPSKNRKDPVPMANLYSMLTSLVGLKELPRNIVKKSLEQLEREKKVVGSHATGWRLTDSVSKDIEKKLRNENSFLDEVLVRHFPQDIKTATLKRWFYDVSAQLFSKFGDALVANISGDSTRKFERYNLVDIVNGMTKKYQLKGKEQSLLLGYESFINSTTHDDQKLITDLAIRWFGARLVVANVGRDPITIDEIKGSKFILDTNVLIAIALGRKPFVKSIEALGKALKNIDAELVYLSLTREQYTNVADYQGDQILRLLESYSLEKIKKLELDEDFIKASLAAGCEDADDFRKYFQGIRDIPKRLQGGPEIKLEEDDQIAKRIESAEKDSTLINLIKRNKIDLRGIEPSEKSLKHDAALIRVAEFLTEDEERRVWSLSFDNVLIYVGIKVAGSDMPRVMGVDTLIEFLALSGAGSDISNTDFAPLLANILKNHCLPYGGTLIRLSDLLKLQATIQEAPNFPVENIRRMAHVVAKARLENKPVENEEIQAELARLQNKEFERYDKRLQKAEKRAIEADNKKQTAEALANKEKNKLARLEENAIEDKASIIKNRLARTLVKSLIFRLVIIGLIVVIVVVATNSIINSDVTAIDLVAGLVGILSFLIWVVSPLKEFRDGVKHADANAKTEIDKLLR